MSVLKSLMSGSQVVGFYPNLARALGGAKAGLFFCQLSYWLGDLSEINRTEAEFEIATALTGHEQAGARQILLEKNAISIERRGAPPRLFYRINWDVVETLLSTLGINSRKSGIEPEIRESIPENRESSILKDLKRREEREEKKESIRRSRLPKDFSLSPELIHYAQKCDLDPAEEFIRFCDYWWADGRQKLDWGLTFQNWCRNQVKWRDEKIAATPRQPELPDWSLPDA